MEILSKLTPAETLLILQPSKAKFRDLLRFTLMDLLIRSVLGLYQSEKKKPGSPLSAFYFIPGKNFRTIEPPLHEMVFLYPFYKNSQKPVAFRMMLRIGYSQGKNESHFKPRYLMKSPHLKNLIKRGFWQKTFGTFALTSEGKKVQQFIIRYFNQLDKTLPDNFQEDEERSKQILRQIKGNILLLNAFRFKLASIIAREFSIIDGEVEGTGREE